MPKFEVTWKECVWFYCSAEVEAKDEQEARQMVDEGEVIDEQPVMGDIEDLVIQRVIEAKE